jgi:hypothetical protein
LKPYLEELMDAHDVSQSSTRRSTTGRSASSQPQMVRYLVPGSYLCCDGRKSPWPSRINGIRQAAY